MDTVRTMSERLPTALPDPSACVADKKMYVLDQLDKLAGKIILDDRVVLGGIDRFSGGEIHINVFFFCE